MSNRLGLLASLAVALLFVYRPGVSATSGSEIIAAEAAIRKSDAEWAAAAKTASVDAWMAFYAADAVVMAPGVQIARDRELVRQTVTSLLALPHLSIAWHPVKVEVAASGDLAYLIGAYDLSYDDARAARVSDQGKLLEIWRKQSDGSWKCIVDTWNSDGPAAAAHAAPAAPATGAAGAVERRPAAVAVPLPPVADSATGPRPSAPVLGSEYGEMPTQYEEAIRQYFQEYLKDPDSVQYKEITKPEKGYVTTVAGVIFAHETRLLGWTVKATINAKNARGTYVGFKTYTFLFRGEKLVHVHTLSPLPAGETR
jgi:ketosteroid isomerase-like protein